MSAKMHACLTALLLLLSVSVAAALTECHRQYNKTAKPKHIATHPDPLLATESQPPSDKSKSRSRRDINERTAVEFDSGQYLFLDYVSRGEEVLDKFTLSVWLYLEGGQGDGATVLELNNVCYDYSSWLLSLRSSLADIEPSALVFSLEDIYGQTRTITKEKYTEHQWIHIAVTNSDEQLRFYVDGARVDTGFYALCVINHASLGEQVLLEGSVVQHYLNMEWADFTNADCLDLRLSDKYGNGFRGKMHSLMIMDAAFSARKIKSLFSGSVSDLDLSSVVQYEEFDDVTQWNTMKPPVVAKVIAESRVDMQLRAPPCGKTVCDDPKVVTSYASHKELRGHKSVNMEIVYFADSDGGFPAVTETDINRHTDFMSRAFQPLNITWNFTRRVIRNTLMNRASTLIDCHPDRIGDGSCDAECNMDALNMDGGDCSHLRFDGCTVDMRGDGHCDEDCNVGYFEFDDGDCCLNTDGFHCINPLSPARSYFHLSEIKELLEPSAGSLSLIIVEWTNMNMLGLAAMPWEHNSQSVFGSVIVARQLMVSNSSLDTIVHEVGHVLGLWHVHHGISEVPCSDECMENEASLVLGDLCDDTSPTARHKTCSDPPPNQQYCVPEALEKTPYDNFMSYASGDCSNSKSFTLQQSARMHCYLDLVHGAATNDRYPSAIPLPLQVTYADTASVTLSWLPPLKTGLSSTQLHCRNCKDDNSYVQYASAVHMVGDSNLDLAPVHAYSHQQAIGPPDSTACAQSPEAFSPINAYYKLYKCDPTCRFVFTFDQEVNPHRISLWITWFPRRDDKVVERIAFLSPSETIVLELLNVDIQCDKPYTKPVHTDSLVKQVVIYATTPNLDIDAVSLISKPNEPACTNCPKLSYQLHRQPAFTAPVGVVTTHDSVFEDHSVELGHTYQYTVQAMLGTVDGKLSPHFVYTHSAEHCGNGIVEGNELCDDSNLANGDGCSISCVLESDFTCVGSPSICWKEYTPQYLTCNSLFTTDKDGCGHYVPESFTDRWSSQAHVSGKYVNCHSPHLLAGPPPTGIECASSQPDNAPVWLPCTTSYSNAYDNYIIRFEFQEAVVAAAVIIHISADGSNEGKSGNIAVSLENVASGQQHAVSTIYSYQIRCKDSPITLSVKHDLTKPFYRSKVVILSMNSRSVSIGAVRLRTFDKFDPVTLETCESKLYNTGTKRCVEQFGEFKQCDPLVIDHANVTCEGESDGDKCTVRCDHGYEPSGLLGAATCIDGKWSPPIKCNIITCNRPAIPMGFAVCETGHHFKSVCNVACTSPSQLMGNGTLIKCLESGLWTESRAYCSPMCEDLEALNAKALDEVSCSGPQEPGTRCTIECKEGYNIGENAKARQDKPVCKDDGEWDTVCVRTTCPSLPPVWRGLYQCTDGDNSGSVCQAVCPTSQEKSIISCNNNGRWNGSFASCDVSGVSCPAIKRADLDLTCQGNLTGDLCRPSCADPELTLYIERKVGEMVKIEWFTDKLQCTSLGDWYPKMDTLVCVQGCQERYINDGWCDAINNRAQCRWDGGDCCRSTAKGQQVQPFPETCTSECTCVDPGASENSMGATVVRFLKYWTGLDYSQE